PPIARTPSADLCWAAARRRDLTAKLCKRSQDRGARMRNPEASCSRGAPRTTCVSRLGGQAGQLGAPMKVGGMALDVPVVDARIHGFLPSVALYGDPTPRTPAPP